MPKLVAIEYGPREKINMESLGFSIYESKTFGDIGDYDNLGIAELSSDGVNANLMSKTCTPKNNSSIFSPGMYPYYKKVYFRAKFAENSYFSQFHNLNSWKKEGEYWVTPWKLIDMTNWPTGWTYTIRKQYSIIGPTGTNDNVGYFKEVGLGVAGGPKIVEDKYYMDFAYRHKVRLPKRMFRKNVKWN